MLFYNQIMKKIFALFLLIFSYCTQASEYEYYCSQNSASKTFGGFIASTSGLNLLSRNIAENSIQKAIKKETDAKFKVKINNFYATNLLNGEFKDLSATAKKYEYDGVYLSNVNINTICSYNHILFENNELYFRENMVLKLNAQLTNEQLKNTISSGKLDKKLTKLLNKILKNEVFIAFANTILPITLPVEINESNKAQLKITRISKFENILGFESYILIPKSK